MGHYIALLVVIITSQIFAVIKFIKQIKRQDNERNKKDKVFTIVWLIAEILSTITIVSFIFTLMLSYGWIPWLIFQYGLSPINKVSFAIRIIYLLKK